MDPAKSALKQPEDMVFGHIHHGTLLYTKEELADRYARGFHFNMKLRRENEALRETITTMTRFHEEERARREAHEREKHPPVPARRQTHEELFNLTEHGRSKDPNHVPAYAAPTVTEVEHRQELADEFGDPEEHEGFVVPHMPKILAEDGMLGPHGDGFGHGPACSSLHEPDETYSFEKTAAELDRLDAAAEREAVRQTYADDNVNRVLRDEAPAIEKLAVELEALEDRLGTGRMETAETGTNPGHYRHADIECIDAIRAALTQAEFRGFCKGNNIKYIWRSNHKGSPTQDLEKAVWYTRMALGDDPRE